MARPNAQNSELDPKTHPSGARIEKMINKQSAGTKTVDLNGDKGLYGETLRPSEREQTYQAPDASDDAVESATPENNRRTPSTRQQ